MLNRRQLVISAAVAGPSVMAADALAQPKGANVPTIEGPVTGGRRGHPFGGYLGDDLAKAGYVEEEYFVSGLAQSYKPVGALTEDGRWTVEPDQTGEYKTRVVVHRPKDPAKFNGVLICEWTNVSTFNDLSNAVNERFFRSGYAYAAVSAQKVGVEGLEAEPDTGLRHWDPERYGALHIPGDGFSYDIFTQVGRALASAKGRAGRDPLPGLKVKHAIAVGQSQSAARLCTYVNAIHPVSTVFSGFIPTVLVGGGSELYSAEVIPGEKKAEYNKRFFPRIQKCVIRDDLKTPVLILNSETEARMFRVPPQPDAEYLRVWEVAGSVHGSACDTGYRPDTSARDGVRDPFGDATAKMVRFMPITEAACQAMVRWIEGGAPLAAQPRLKRGADLRVIEVDAHGNALGGARLPEVVVPTATFDTKTSPASGGRKPFSPEELRSLYPTDQDYVGKVRAAAEASRGRDLLLPYHVAEYVEAARKGPAAAN